MALLLERAQTVLPESLSCDWSARLSPFTYFETTKGLIGYSRGIWTTTPSGELAVRSTLVYTPKLEGVGHQKIVFNGYPEDRAKLARIENSDSQQYVRDHFSFDRCTQEYGWNVPLADISRVFDPYQALHEWLFQDGTIAHNLRRIVTYLTDEVGIALVDIGVYGSLQCGLKQNGDAVHDYDLLIRGTENMSKIRSMRDCARVTEKSLDLTANGRGTARLHRRAGATFCLEAEKQGEIVIELKVDRAPDDQNSYERYCHELFHQSRTVISGTVTDDSESLCTPNAYQVTTDAGIVVHVVSSYYDFIGAARLGDRVSACGRLSVDGRALLLSNPQRDYILNRNQIAN